MDGKQARRTGTSGPLGELFDHGLDSYSAVLIPIYMFSLFGTDDLPAIRMFFVIWNVFLNFYLTHVEKYNTGVMFLPWGYDFTMWVSGQLNSENFASYSRYINVMSVPQKNCFLYFISRHLIIFYLNFVGSQYNFVPDHHYWSWYLALSDFLQPFNGEYI